MAGLLLIGIVWFIVQVCKEANIKDYGKSTGKYRDWRQSSIDHSKVLRGELSQKEYNRRLNSSYYYTKDSLYD